MTTEPEAKGADARDFLPDGDSWPWDELSLVHKQMAEKQAIFLAAYVELGTVAAAVRAARMSRTSHEWWMDHDSLGFRDRFQRALEARRDVVEGWVYDRLQDPKGNRGSDLLLMFANKGLNPDKWAVMAPMPDSGSKELLAQVLKLSKKEAKREAVKELKERNEVEESVG